MSPPDAFAFRCPSCDGPGRARPEWVGRMVRCKHCKATFRLPTPEETGAISYDLAEPIAVGPNPAPAVPGPAAGPAAPAGESTLFSPTYRDAPLPDVPREGPPRKKKRPRQPSPRERFEAARDDRRVQALAAGGVVLAVVAVAAFVVPGFGLIGGGILAGVGLLLMAVGFFVGAYAAFREDFLYGFAYVVFPIYTGYYLVTRFDDLWPYFTASTVGFVLFLIGTRALEMSLAG